jgi:hypothetical protein
MLHCHALAKDVKSLMNKPVSCSAHLVPSGRQCAHGLSRLIGSTATSVFKLLALVDDVFWVLAPLAMGDDENMRGQCSIAPFNLI